MNINAFRCHSLPSGATTAIVFGSFREVCRNRLTLSLHSNSALLWCFFDVPDTRKAQKHNHTQSHSFTSRTLPRPGTSVLWSVQNTQHSPNLADSHAPDSPSSSHSRSPLTISLSFRQVDFPARSCSFRKSKTFHSRTVTTSGADNKSILLLPELDFKL